MDFFYLDVGYSIIGEKRMMSTPITNEMHRKSIEYAIKKDYIRPSRYSRYEFISPRAITLEERILIMERIWEEDEKERSPPIQKKGKWT